MIVRKAAFSSTRATALGVATALALTAIAPTVASAASSGKGLTAATSGMTDVSSVRRRAYYPGGAAAIAGVVGTGLAIAGAAAASRAYYDDGYGYGGGGPVYVAPAPYGYGGYGGYGGYNSYGASVPLDQNGHPNASW
jgi:hypothetical protein